MLERNEHAEIATRWIDASDEGHEQNGCDGLRRREYDACENAQSGADEKQAPQFVAGRNEACDQRQRSRSQQRSAGDNSDLLRRETNRRKVDRENDDGEAVAEPAKRPRAIQVQDIRRRFGQGERLHRDARRMVRRIKKLAQDMSHLHNGARQLLTGRLPIARTSMPRNTPIGSRQWF
jgi:hypothetical protein